MAKNDAQKTTTPIEVVPNRVSEAYRDNRGNYMQVLRDEVHRSKETLAEIGERRARQKAA